MREFIEVEWQPSGGVGGSTGIDGALLSATSTSNWIDTHKATQVVLEVDIVNGGGAALPVVFYIDSQRDNDVATIVREEMIGSDGTPGATETGAVITSLYRRKYLRTTRAAATTQSFTIPLPALYHRIRISGLTAAGAGATDKVTVHARVRF